MSVVRVAFVAAILLSGRWGNASAAAQDLVLTERCEDGFRRLIHMAQTGQLGSDVTNANVGILNNQVRVELVRAGAANKLLVLTLKSSPHTISRYFDVAPGEGATASDVVRVGKALDEVFVEDPFQVLGLEETLSGTRIPSFTEAWAYGGWREVLRVFERRMMVIASVRYTITVIAALAAGLVASLSLLWGSAPPSPR